MLTMHNPSHPGRLIKNDYMEPLGLSVTEMANGLGVSRRTMSMIVNERAGISPAMAYKLAHAFDTSVGLWINLQAQHARWMARGTDISHVRRFEQAQARAH